MNLEMTVRAMYAIQATTVAAMANPPIQVAVCPAGSSMMASGGRGRTPTLASARQAPQWDESKETKQPFLAEGTRAVRFGVDGPLGQTYARVTGSGNGLGPTQGPASS